MKRKSTPRELGSILSLIAIIFTIFIFSISTKSVFAGECALDEITPDSGGQNWDVTYCLTADTQAELQTVSSVTATCRGVPDDLLSDIFPENLSCHEEGSFFGAAAVSQSQSINVGKIVDGPNGGFMSCYTLTSLDRNMGEIDVDFKTSSGANFCPTQRTPVSPLNYTIHEYFENTLATQLNIGEVHEPGVSADAVYCETNVAGEKIEGINTAIGCIKVGSTTELVTTIFRFAIGVGGGLALALILYGVFIITTSAGIPDKLKAGSEIITSAIIGLIFILLSVFLFKLIGYNILGIPGLT